MTGKEKTMYNEQDVQTVSKCIASAVEFGIIKDPEAIRTTLLQALDKKPGPDDFMSKKDIIQFFGIHEQTYFRWLKKGILKPYGYGKKMRFLRSDVIKIRKDHEK